VTTAKPAHRPSRRPGKQKCGACHPVRPGCRFPRECGICSSQDATVRLHGLRHERVLSCTTTMYKHVGLATGRHWGRASIATTDEVKTSGSAHAAVPGWHRMRQGRIQWQAQPWPHRSPKARWLSHRHPADAPRTRRLLGHSSAKRSAGSQLAAIGVRHVCICLGREPPRDQLALLRNPRNPQPPQQWVGASG
jgi:hypothetical protein